MCLDLLTTKRTLLKDKKIWKAVYVRDGKEYPCIQFADSKRHIRGTSFPPLKQLKRKNKAKKKKIDIFLKAGYGTKYDTGFHCFVTKEDTEYLVSWMPGSSAKSYIIPAGTKVQYGRQEEKRVVVSPVLINPRLAK